MTAKPLILTRDPDLLAELLRLAAAAGADPDVVDDPVRALRQWQAAPVVLVGLDLAEQTALCAPPRRDGVHAVGHARLPDDAFRIGIMLGAESVTRVTHSEGWLVDLLTDLDDPGRGRGVAVAVTAGSGGAGASTFAAALGQVAARTGPTLVIDADPLGAGLDRILGVDGVEGVRWDALQRTSGRLGARALREAVPRNEDGPGVLTWYSGPAGTLQAFAAREALAAGQRGHDTVVLDLPRAGGELVEELAARCDCVVVVVVPTVAGVASAVRTCSRYADLDRALVIRGRGVPEPDIARVTGVREILSMNSQRGLDESVDLGAGPVRSRRGPLARTATALLDGLGRTWSAA